MEDEFFVFDFPVFTLVDSGRFEKTNSVNRGMIRVGTPEHGDFIPLFTEQLHAERAADTMSHPPKTVISLLNGNATRILLEEFERIGVKYVGIDVEFGSAPRGRFFPIKVVIDRMPAD